MAPWASPEASCWMNCSIADPWSSRSCGRRHRTRTSARRSIYILRRALVLVLCLRPHERLLHGSAMEQFIQQLASGLAHGAIYAARALALVMLFLSASHIYF